MQHDSPPRVLLYSPDSFGLGHLRRSLTLAAAISRHEPQTNTLCLTGSPMPELFDLPPRCDIVKLPSLDKNAAGELVPRNLGLDVRELSSLRTELIHAAVRSFRPEIMVVDHSPTGPGQELLPVLQRLDREQTKVVLGLRDLLDTPLRAVAELRSNGALEAMHGYYDHVFVYGDKKITNIGDTYQLPTTIREKLEYVGIVSPRLQHAPRREESSRKRILITAGGDGGGVLRAALAALLGPLRNEDLEITMVTGPLMDESEIKELKRAAGSDSRIHVSRYSRKLSRKLGEADLVISMAGYNSVYESLSQGKPLIVMPRVHPRQEQLERARRLQSLGWLTIAPDDAASNPQSLAETILTALASDRTQVDVDLPFDGAEQATQRIFEIINEARLRTTTRAATS